MKNFLHLLTLALYIFSTQTVDAAKLSLVAPERAPSNGDLVSVLVTLDPEGEVVSGLSGSFSFDDEIFSIESISIEGSVVSPWIIPPVVSKDFSFDRKTHVLFEGVFAGGFNGVRSPYYQGEREGKVFSIVLRPKKIGETNLVLDSLALHAFNEEATLIPLLNVAQKISVSPGTQLLKKGSSNPKRVDEKGVTVMVTKSDLINSGALYVVVDAKEARSSITEMYVAETDIYNGELVAAKDWRKAGNPYILQLQDRSKYIHVKIIYSDDTYTITTVQPVDNIQKSLLSSHILLGIGILIVVFCLYVYSRKQKLFCSNKI